MSVNRNITPAPRPDPLLDARRILEEPAGPAPVLPTIVDAAKLTLPAWVIPLPFVKALSMNDRMNHWVKANATREWRDATRWSVRAARVPHCERIRVCLHYIPKAIRRRDPNNLVLAMKACEDALVDEGVVDDDTLAFMEREYPMIHPPDSKIVGGRFWLTVVQLA